MSIFNIYDLKQIDRLEIIANGSFGEVYKVKDKKRNKIYAAKISYKIMTSEDMIHDLSREVNILSKTNHPSIIRFIGFSPINFFKEQKPVIITEFLSNGTLYDIIESEKKGLSQKSWTDTRKLINIYGIAAAMSYLHKHNIIHRDLKPANILMDDNLFPKIADFGLSKVNNKNDATQSISEVKGTPIYIAPEVWSNAEYTTACDVYSYAIIVYEIMTSNDPFKGFNSNQIMMKIQDGLRPKIDLLPSESYQQLIENCWQQDPNNRPTFDKILESLERDHGFITGLVDEDEYLDYVDFIKNYPISFIDKDIKIGPYFDFTHVKTHSEEKETNNNDHIKIKISLYKAQDFERLDYSCQQLVIEAEKDIECQFQVGQNLMEGKNGFSQNTQLSISYLKRATEKGCLNSALYYSRILIKGEIIPQNLEQAKKLLKKHTKSGNGDALFLIGRIKKKEGNHIKANKYFEKAADAGNAEAMYEIGKMLFRGVGCTKDLKKASLFFNMAKKNGLDKSDKYVILFVDESRLLNAQKMKIAADKGNVDAMLNYATMLQNGDGIPSNKSKAAKYYQMAIEKGSVDAMNSYGNMLLIGDGIPVNKSEAVRYYKMAIEKGDAESMNTYAIMLKNGDGIPVDKGEAVKYYKMAIEKGHASAMFNYGTMLKYGDGIPVDKDEAVKYYKMAIEKGHASAMLNYATMLKKGDGIRANKKKAVKYYKMAIEKGSVDAMNNYGNMLLIGDGIPVNKIEAAKYYKMASEKGNPVAMYNYANMLKKGDGIPVDKGEASRYYKMAADKGHAAAMNTYANMRKNGDGIQVDIDEAVKYYEMAIEKGNVDAMLTYAAMLDTGDGIPINRSYANEIYRMAAGK